MLDPDIIGAEFRQGSSEIVGSNPAPRDQDVSAGRGFFSGLPCFRAVCLQGRNLHEKRQGFSSRPLCRNSVCYGCRHYRTRLRWWPGVVLHSAMGDPRCPLHNRSGYELEEAGLGNEQEDHLRERFLFRHDSCILVFLWRNRLLVSPKIPPRALHASPLDIYFHNHHPFVLPVRCPRIFPVGSMILLRPHISSLGATFPTWLLETKNTEFFGARAGSTMSLKRMLSPQEGQAVGDRMICAPLMASMRLTSGNRMRSAPAPAAS